MTRRNKSARCSQCVVRACSTSTGRADGVAGSEGGGVGTALGVGGIMPTAIAYLVEIAPKRFRVTMVMCGVLGFTTGIAVCGQVAAWLIPIWWS